MGVLKRSIKSKSGNATDYWYIRYTFNGRDKWESVGKVGVVTKAVAQARLEERKRQIRLGQSEQIVNAIPTLDEVTVDYIKHVRDTVKKRSWKRDELCLRHLTAVFGDRKLSQITPRDIDDYKALRRSKVAPATVNRELEVLRYLFNLSKRWKKFFGENPVSQAGLLPLNNQVENILTPEEQEMLLNASPPHLSAILVCALNTGMRKGEIISLKWHNIDLENNIITLEHTNTKNNKTRKVPINSVLRQVLIEQKLKSRGNEYVFLNSEGRPYMRQDSLNRVFLAAIKRAKIDSIRFHDLRHTAATRMVESGANIVAVSRILGHADLKTTMRYAHPDDSLRDATEKLGEFNLNCSKNRSNENDDKMKGDVSP